MNEPTDDELEALVAAVIGDSPVPSAQTEFAIEAFSLARLDEELAELVFDSTSETALAGVRSDEADRIHHSYVQGTITLDIEWEPGPIITLTGQVDAEAPQEVILRRPDGDRSADLNEFGEFSFPQTLPGPARITCLTGDQRLETDWFML